MPEPRPLRVLLLDAHSGGGGQVSYVTRLAAQLVRLGHEPRIGCRPGSVLIAGAAAAGCAAEAHFAFARGFRPAPMRRDLAAMRALLRGWKPDVLHVSGSQDHWCAALANRTLGAPAALVRTRHNTYPVRGNLPNRVLNRRWTDYQIVVCDVVRRTLAAQPAFDAARMTSIHNGVDAEAFKPDAVARAAMRAAFGYGEADLVCGIAARLVKAKGHTYLFRAVASLRARWPQLRVLALGQGPLEAALRAETEALGIADIVQWAGFRDDMAACVQAFDIAVQPSIDCDTSSFALKEAMAAEKPAVASDYGGLVEILDDGAEGYVAPAGEAEPLAAAIERLLADPGLRAAMGGRGRARVLRDFTLEHFAARTVEAYRAAIGLHAERYRVP